MSDEPVMHLSVMISSTFVDVKGLRSILIKAAMGAGLHPRAMEHDQVMPDADVVDNSLKMVREAFAYVLLIGHRYGQRPVCATRNPRQLSITELEFNEALRLGRPIQLYLLSNSYPVAREHIDTDPANLESLKNFRQRAKSMDGSGGVNRIYKEVSSKKEFEIAVGPLMLGLKQSLQTTSTSRKSKPTKPSTVADPGSTDSAKPTTTRLQRAVEKILNEIPSSSSEDQKQFLGALKIHSFEGLLAMLSSAGGAYMVEQVRAKALSLWRDKRPDEASARLALLIFLIGAEKRLVDASSSITGPAHLELDSKDIAALLGACLLDSGLCLQLDSAGARVSAQNVITDLSIMEGGSSPLARVQMELQAKERRLRQPPGAPIASVESLLDDESFKARLDIFESEYGVRLAIGVRADDPLLRSDQVRVFLTKFEVGLFSYSRNVADTFAASLRTAVSSLVSALDDVAAAIFGRVPTADDSTSERPAIASFSAGDESQDILKWASTREDGPGADGSRRCPFVFFSYSHEKDDEKWNANLIAQLKALEVHGKITLWVDQREIAAGQRWNDEIQAAIGKADVAVLMVSKHFMNSTYIRHKELPPLRAREKAGLLRFVPVLVGACPWKHDEELQSLQFALGTKPLDTLTRIGDLNLATTKIAEKVLSP